MRRRQKLEGMWRKSNKPHVQWDAAAQKLWRRVRNNPEDHEMEEQLIDKWTSDPPTTSKAIFDIRSAQARIARRI